ncbi:MAG: orotidine-5'-phosphate decarboxylase [Anaerolineaceae bacterium]|nr:orotidine-5'-phosphate decarboxylase [Anaerolineaceae bacterium]
METQSFFSRLEERARKLDSLLCVGLDAHPADLTEDTASAAREFCLRLVAATQDLAVAFKPNAAFFEAYGAEGWQALADVIDAIPESVPVILDAKRGDISSTAEAYARSVFEALKADAVTLNPYLGQDALTPFKKDPAHGVFVLCKTSNPGSGDMQDLQLVNSGSPITVYEKVAQLAERWNALDNVGIVVGATYPEALRRVRILAPNLWILAPGVGAQGGELSSALAAGLRADGLGLLVPVSRQISRADDPRLAAEQITNAIRQARSDSSTSKSAEESPSYIGTLAEGLLKAGCVQFGNFTLKSGLQSPIYLDLRRLVSMPSLLAEVGVAYSVILKKLHFDRLAALPYAALPMATAISLQNGWPLIYPRKEAKAYGTRAEIEGVYQAGERTVVIDDLATTGESKFEAIEKLKSAGLIVEDVVVLIDRQSGAAESLAGAGYRLHAVFTLTDLLDYYQANHSIPNEQISAARDFIKSS